MDSRLYLLVMSCLLSSKSLLLDTRADLIDNWLEWSPWTTCTEPVYCLEGSRQRERQCERGKRCIGIEEESEDCPRESCRKHEVFQDIAHAAEHSFIEEECSTSTKYFVKGKYAASLLKHNVSNIFPKLKDVLHSGFFNVKVTRKKLASEKDIYKYCFEPSINPTIEEFASLIALGRLKFKYATIYCPLPKPNDQRLVTGVAIGVQDSGQLYAVYTRVTTEKGFRHIFYKFMYGPYSDAFNLVWD